MQAEEGERVRHSVFLFQQQSCMDSVIFSWQHQVRRTWVLFSILSWQGSMHWITKSIKIMKYCRAQIQSSTMQWLESTFIETIDKLFNTSVLRITQSFLKLSSLWSMRLQPFQSLWWSSYLDHTWLFCHQPFMDTRAQADLCLSNSFPPWSNKTNSRTKEEDWRRYSLMSQSGMAVTTQLKAG